MSQCDGHYTERLRISLLVSGAWYETLVMSKKCTCLKLSSPTPTSFWSNRRRRKFFFLFLLVNTNLPSKHCRVWVMDIWKNPKWVIWFAGVRMWMSCLTPDSSSNFSWNGWYLQISGKVSMYLLLMFVQLWSKIHHTLNFRRQNNWKSPKHQKHSSHYMYISILL